jgi:GAF domain-containing protein
VTGPADADQSLIAMAGILVTEQSMESTLRQVLELACAALPGGDEGGITLLTAEGPDTAVATSAAALRIDRTQYHAETGGPCLDAYRRQEVLRIDSTASDGRWPEFSGVAAAEGVGSTLSVPLVVGGDGLGALNIYCHREYGFPAADERLAVSLGSCASVAVANARGYWRVARLAGQLEQALATRGVVDQATGILIAQHRCPAEHARHLLAAVAQRNRLTLTDVASDLVRRTSAEEPEPPTA